MDIGVLGPLVVNGTLKDNSSHGFSPRDRVVLLALAMRPGEILGPEVLADALWGEAPPESWSKVVQGCVVRLRKTLGPDAIETTPHGYRLLVHADDLDHRLFERRVVQARDHLAGGEPERAAFLVGEALALWRGRPLVDLEEWAPGRAEAERLLELRLDAEDLETEAALLTGRHREILAAASSRVAAAPLRERRWALLAQAQYQSGRQSDALTTLRRARSMLDQELGLDPSPDLIALEQAILRQDPALVAVPALPEPSATCPYQGLMAYDVQDSDAFFGREKDVAAGLARLDAQGVLAVVGPSGCGKSSLVRAGVAAALRRDGRSVVVVTPGRHPLDSLTALRSKHAVLVVDQCEEALSADVDPTEQQAFLDALVQHGETGTLVMAFRADRLGGLSAHPGLARLTERGLYLLGMMSADDLRSAVQGPAVRAGLRLEPGLVDLLVREVEGEPGALPLLSHVLRQTWERREGSTLTVAGYTASGGVREAVARSAEAVYEQVEPRQRAVLRDLMLRLVSATADGDPVRTRVSRRQVATDEEHEQLIERMVRARLVSSDGNSFEIAHEALARVWPRLRAWLDDDVEGQRLLRHLAVAADTWESMERPHSELYRGVRLAKAVEWRRASSPDLTKTERDFLDASEDVAEQERRTAEQQVRHERRANRRLRALLAGVAALLVVALVTGGLALTAAQRADRQANAAERQAIAADARRIGAEALTSTESDTSLMLAAAGVALDDSVDTRANLLAELDRLPALLRVTHAKVQTIGGLSISPVDGRIAAAAPLDGVVFYDGASLTELGRNAVGSGVATAFSPDGRLVAVSAGNQMELGAGKPDLRTLRLVDADGRLAPAQPGGIPPGYLCFDAAAFSPDGRWLAARLSTHSSALVAVWDLHRPAKPAALFTVPFSSRFIAVAADSKRLFTGGDAIRSWDLLDGTLRKTVTAADLGAAQLSGDIRASADGRTLAVLMGPEVGLLDAASLTLRTRLVGRSPLREMAFSRDGTRFTSYDGSLVVWDISSSHPVEVFRGDGWGTDVPALSPDGRTLYSSGNNGRLMAWDVAGDRRFLPVRPGSPQADPGGLTRVSDDGKAIAYWGGASLQARDVATGKLGPLIDAQHTLGSFQELAWSHNHQALIGVFGDALVRVWDPWTGRLVATRSLAPDAISSAAFSKDGRTLLIGTSGGLIQVLDATTLKSVRRAINPGLSVIFNLHTSPDGHTMLIGGATGARLADYVSRRLGRRVPQEGFFSPDGKRIAVLEGGGVGLQKTDSPEWISPPATAQPYGGEGSAFSSDGTRFASSAQGKVAVWDGRTGAFIGAVAADGEAGVGFLDSSTVVIAGSDGSVRTWDLRASTWKTAVCRMSGRGLTMAEWHSFLPDRAYQNACR